METPGNVTFCIGTAETGNCGKCPFFFRKNTVDTLDVVKLHVC